MECSIFFSPRAFRYQEPNKKKQDFNLRKAFRFSHTHTQKPAKMVCTRCQELQFTCFRVLDRCLYRCCSNLNCNLSLNCGNSSLPLVQPWLPVSLPLSLSLSLHPAIYLVLVFSLHIYIPIVYTVVNDIF